MARILRIMLGLWEHPSYGPIAKHAVRLATAALVRHVRTQTRIQKTWSQVS